MSLLVVCHQADSTHIVMYHYRQLNSDKHVTIVVLKRAASLAVFVASCGWKKNAGNPLCSIQLCSYCRHLMSILCFLQSSAFFDLPLVISQSLFLARQFISSLSSLKLSTCLNTGKLTFVLPLPLLLVTACLWSGAGRCFALFC